MKVIKMTFHERFLARVGGNFRSNAIEAQKKRLAFWNWLGTIKDSCKGSRCRSDTAFLAMSCRIIVIYIAGKTIAESVLKLGENHEDYFYNHLPSILDEYANLVEAIKFLHDNGEKHGDIRRDHIIIDKETGIGKWIDFDFNYLHNENMAGYDLFGLGNVIIYLVGKGDILRRET